MNTNISQFTETEISFTKDYIIKFYIKLKANNTARELMEFETK